MTLTETAALTKKAFIFGVLFLFLCLAAWGAYQYYYYNIYLPNLPKVEEKPELKFGSLPALKLPSNQTSSQNYNYNMDTETGALPTEIPKLIKVYPIIPLSTDLLALDRARNLADKLDFKNGPDSLTSTQYKFTDNQGGEFIINLDNGNFKYNHILASESAQLSDRINFVDTQSLISEFRNFLSSKSLLKEDLNQGRSRVVTQKASKQDSNFATLYLWQQDIEETPMITPKFNTSPLSAVVIKSRDEIYKYKSLEYTYWPIDLENSSTYPIKKAEDAFSELKSGGGTILILPVGPNVSINKVYLGYYLSDQLLDYLQPVFVFQGGSKMEDANFAAIVPAISPEQIKKDE